MWLKQTLGLIAFVLLMPVYLGIFIWMIMNDRREKRRVNAKDKAA